MLKRVNSLDESAAVFFCKCFLQALMRSWKGLRIFYLLNFPL